MIKYKAEVKSIFSYKSGDLISNVRQETVSAVVSISADSDRDKSFPFRELLFSHLGDSLLN